MEPDVYVRALKTLSELQEIYQVWECWSGNRDSEMESYLRFLGSNPAAVRPHVLVVYRGGVPDAILVGRIDRGQISCGVGYLHMRFKARIMCFVYGALRGNPSKENCDLMVSEIRHSLSQGEAEVAYMNFLPKDSDLCRLAMKRPGLLSRDYVRITQPHFTIKLPATVEEYYRGLSSGARWQVKNKQKKLLKEFGGEVRIRCFRDATEIDAMVQDVEQVARTSYQRGLGVGFVDGPETREQLRFKAQKGWLRAYVLYVAERPRAFWIGDMNQGTFGSDFLAYDAELGNYSPGMFLITKVIEGFCDGTQEGITGVDFGPGNAQYKDVLSNNRWQETSVYIFAPSLKGVSLNLLRSSIGGIDHTIKRALARTNLLRKIKKLWRAYATPKEATQS